ncbi:MAG: arsenite methyltransferase [Planctomycetia bacterium]|nr:arsenite methyltransferase [Planctomycetia bacterium]
MSEPITDAVRAKYGAVAASKLTGESAGVRAVAEAFGYTPEELAELPAEVNMGLGCGSPTAMANLKPGEVVVDLGCGGGIDVFLASRKVGLSGRAIGIDMTPEMIARARRSAEKLASTGEQTNVEFHLANMESLPLPDNSVDCLISNCVINLAADKSAVFREMFRVLKPGGRVAVSDIVLKKPLPDELAKSVAAYTGCVAGALVADEYERRLREAGFAAVQVIDAKKDLNAYAKVETSGCGCASAGASSQSKSLPIADEQRIADSQSCCDTEPTPASASVHDELTDLLSCCDANEFAASARVFAVKPA